jgi:hypothetical protein
MWPAATDIAIIVRIAAIIVGTSSVAPTGTSLDGRQFLDRPEAACFGPIFV